MSIFLDAKVFQTNKGFSPLFRTSCKLSHDTAVNQISTALKNITDRFRFHFYLCVTFMTRAFALGIATSLACPTGMLVFIRIHGFPSVSWSGNIRSSAVFIVCDQTVICMCTAQKEQTGNIQPIHCSHTSKISIKCIFPSLQPDRYIKNKNVKALPKNGNI